MTQPQPKPTENPDSVPIEPRVMEDWEAIRLAQYKKGIAKYGQPVVTFNGRNQALDAKQEMLDTWRYVTALEMEHEWFQGRVKELEGDNGWLRGRNSELEALLLKLEKEVNEFVKRQAQ